MQISRPVPTTRPRRPGRRRKLAALTTLGVAGLLAGLLVGCGSSNSPQINTVASTKSYAATAGNWKFTSGTAAFAGALTVSGTSVTATLHPLSTTCAAAAGAFMSSGTISATNALSITSSNYSGGKLSIAGTLAADQHSLTSPTVTVTSGTCATASLRAASPSPRDMATPTAQQYQPLTGNYDGTFTDASGATLTVAATLSQPTTPDTNGVYHLTGYATFPNTPCLSTPVITDSTITGDTIQATYTDKDSGSVVVGDGTFSPDAQTLTITNWILSGCGADTGTGLLLRQTN